MTQAFISRKNPVHAIFGLDAWNPRPALAPQQRPLPSTPKPRLLPEQSAVTTMAPWLRFRLPKFFRSKKTSRAAPAKGDSGLSPLQPKASQSTPNLSSGPPLLNPSHQLSPSPSLRHTPIENSATTPPTTLDQPIPGHGKLSNHLNEPPRAQHPSPQASVNSDIKPTQAETLPRLTKEILDVCPRLRVLVVGKSGVGKSSLIDFTFGVDMKSVAHNKRGINDINYEITSPQNNRFVLHDSMGFEHGDVENLITVKSFLESRSGQDVALKERVHVIWLCIQVPHAGGRVFENGDEELLKIASEKKIPVIVVFTQYDTLIASVEKNIKVVDGTPEEKILQLCNEHAEVIFQRHCVEPLKRLNDQPGFSVTLQWAQTSGLSGKRLARPNFEALHHLTQITRDLVETEIEGKAWIVYAIAQRSSAQVKIMAAIEVGMKRYWQGLASSTYFFGSSLEKCLDTVHVEMVDCWNLYDQAELLLGTEFRKKVKILAQLVTPDENEINSLFNHPNLDAIQSWLGLAGAVVAAAAGPAIAAIGVTAWFANFIANVYQKTPEVLRCFMGYIIDLTLILNELFLVVLAIKPPRPLKDEDIDLALHNYNSSDLRFVHREIRQYVREADWRQLIRSDAAEVKVKELILRYSSPGNRADNAS
ncbi:hypothetical protein GGX14DRAFT_542752 [Mycena pura]|uniref:G domain-containing protein n=1 Tax=Mycena pura TaxID=153505 RepID=A0AAD6VJR5_9AGAR|nr:hypothetical protein GGX14DRAFT_542752 [Mycena pura]